MLTVSELKERLGLASNLEESARALVDGIVGELDKLTHDPVAIKALADGLRASAGEVVVAMFACANKGKPEAVKAPPTSETHARTGPDDGDDGDDGDAAEKPKVTPHHQTPRKHGR